MTAPRPITSLANDRVKFIRALDMRKTRKETGVFVAEGLSILVTAREMGFTPQILVFQAGSASSGVAKGLVDGALKAGAECLEVTRHPRKARRQGKPADHARRLRPALGGPT